MAIPVVTQPMPQPIDLRCSYRRFHEFEYVVRPPINTADSRVDPSHDLWHTVVCRHCHAKANANQIEASLQIMGMARGVELHLIYRPPTVEELLLASR